MLDHRVHGDVPRRRDDMIDEVLELVEGQLHVVRGYRVDDRQLVWKELIDAADGHVGSGGQQWDGQRADTFRADQGVGGIEQTLDALAAARLRGQPAVANRRGEVRPLSDGHKDDSPSHSKSRRPCTALKIKPRFVVCRKLYQFLTKF